MTSIKPKKRRVKKIGKRGKIQGKWLGLPQAGSAPAKRKAAARTTGTTKKRPTRKR